MTTELWRWDAVDVARAVRTRAVSAREVAAAAVVRMLEPSFPRGFDTADRAGMDEALLAQRPQLMVPLSGTPAVSVPTGLQSGLPMGVLLTGPRVREDLCLDAALVIEARAPALTSVDPT